MTTFVQETDQRVVDQPPEFRFIIAGLVRDETSGGFPMVHYRSLFSTADVISEAWDFANNLDEGSLRTQVRTLLSTLQETFSDIDFDTEHLPSLQPHLVEDGSLLFEWVLPHFRIGYGIEPDESQSGWFLATTPELGNIGASGHISGLDLAKLTKSLAIFLILQSYQPRL